MGDDDRWVPWKHAGQEYEQAGRPQLAAACYRRAYDLLGRDPDGPGFAPDLHMAGMLLTAAERCETEWKAVRRV